MPDIKVPKKYAHKVSEAYEDSDGFWAVTNWEDGYFSPDERDSTLIHEETNKDLMAKIRKIRKSGYFTDNHGNPIELSQVAKSSVMREEDSE